MIAKERRSKYLFFSGLFELKKISYRKPRNGKYVDTVIHCTDLYLNTYFNATVKKFSRGQMRQTDLWGEIITKTYEALMKINLEKNFEELSEHEQNRVRKYIKKYVYYGLKDASNPHTKKTTARINGERKTISIDLKPQSIDMLIQGEDSETALINLLHEDSSIFYQNEQQSYQMNYFIHWYNEAKGTVLTDSQLKFLDDLQKVKKLSNPTPEEIREMTGTESHQVNQKLNRIYNRVMKAWEEVSESKKLETKNRKIINDINLIEGYFMLLNDGGENQEENLSKYIKHHFNKLEPIFYPEVNAEQAVELTKLSKCKGTKLSKRTLYKTTDILNKQLELLNKRLITNSEREPITIKGSIKIEEESKSNIYYLTAKGLIAKEEF